MFDWSSASDIWGAIKIEGAGGCSAGMCADMLYSEANVDFWSGANGRFVIYPNKINSNSIKSVYLK